MKSTASLRTAALAVLATGALLAAPAASAAPPGDLADLVGARGSSGEQEMQSRGYTNVTMSRGTQYWWNAARGSCVGIRVANGRYQSVDAVSASRCGQQGASAGQKARVNDLIGGDPVKAFDIMTSRGFTGVDTYTTPDDYLVTWWYNASTGQCANTQSKNNRVTSATEDRSPKCDEAASQGRRRRNQRGGQDRQLRHRMRRHRGQAGLTLPLPGHGPVLRWPEDAHDAALPRPDARIDLASGQSRRAAVRRHGAQGGALRELRRRDQLGVRGQDLLLLLGQGQGPFRGSEAAQLIDDARAGGFLDSCMRRRVLVLRLIYVVSGVLATAAGALVTASLFIAERAPHSTKFLGISLVVSAVFLGVGLVLLGIQRHVAAVAGALRGQGDASALATHARQLVGYLLAAGAFVGVVLALLTYAILARIDQGFAVFG